MNFVEAIKLAKKGKKIKRKFLSDVLKMNDISLLCSVNTGEVYDLRYNDIIALWEVVEEV
jgi:hypothetical protein